MAEEQAATVVEDKQSSNADDASALMTTLDKLESFKRYSLALVIVAIWGLAIMLMGLGILAMIWKGQYDAAIEAAKWLIALVGLSVSGILGFYFGSNSVKAAP
jgi:hypothetical protein